MRRHRFALAVLLLLVVLPLAACAAGEGGVPPLQAGLFSWNPRVVNEPDELLATMTELGLDTLYQEFSSEDSTADQLASFLSAAESDSIGVYALDGDPSWGLEPDGEGLRGAVRRALSIDKSVAEVDGDGADAGGTGIPQLKGIVLDAEPYILDEWDEDPEGSMETFIAASRSAYELAHENGLEVIICIPYYYEEETSPELLEELIGQCCDQVAVMNYDRGDEVANLETEAQIARDHGKGLITIYETQPPNDYYSVEPDDTYWDQGLDAVWENYDEVQAAYPDQPVSIALHDYGNLRELLER